MMAFALSRLADLRVLFGHQSVGENILSGVRQILNDHGVATWPVVDVEEAARHEGGCLAHARVGTNGDPRSKTRDFSRLVDGPLGDRVDVALHKYCYVDIEAATDVRDLFTHYREAMAALRTRHPKVDLVHTTVPLVRVRTGARARLQQALGRPSPRVADNKRREEFNDLLRREYEGFERVFDLAAFEADGSTRSLRADFTDDGGHLNAAGQRHVAQQFVNFLSACAEDRRRPRPHATAFVEASSR
jgi:hypothetical protein